MSKIFSVVLSYAELAYLLTLSGAEPTFGVDRKPFDGLDTGQIAVAHATARDALRARDLIRLDTEGLPLVNDDLLGMLESYASPRIIVTAYRYVAGQELPLAWFGYLNRNTMVIHTRPGDLLHAFTVAPDVQFLARAMVDFCTDSASPMPTGAQVTLPARTMAAARVHADAGQVDQVVQVLHTASLDNDTAAALAADLSNPKAVTAITVAKTGGDAELHRRDAIYWQSTQRADRLIVYTERDEVQISNGSDTELLAILSEMM